MKEETSLQNSIKIALSQKNCVVHRANVGLFYTVDGRLVHIGTSGHSDLYGHRPDGKAFYVEVKTAFKRPTREQQRFLDEMQATGALAGVARSSEEAIQIVFPEVNSERELI